VRPAYPFEGIRWGIGAFGTLAVPAAAVYIWRDSWWPLALFMLWTIGAGAVYVAGTRRRMRAQNIRMLDHARKSAIRTLSHHRHDWMNDLQILYGYLRLNKPDKAAEIVDRIRERMEADSKLSQLGNAELTTFLLSFRTVCDHMRLDVSVGEGVNLEIAAPEADKLAACLIGLINAVRYRSLPSSAAENVLHVRLGRNGRNISVELMYEGEWTGSGSLSEEAANLVRGIGQWSEEDTAESRPGSARKITVTIPLTA
jgi:stage 0 sporulation protein B (sporulation initiation phosphotransferase)